MASQMAISPPPPTELSYYPLRRAVCSSTPALAWVGVGMPFDVVRVRLQATSRDAFRGPWHCLTTTVRREGLRALWQGSLPQLMMSVPYCAVMFGVYHHLQPAYPSVNASPAEMKNYYTGVFGAGVASGVAVNLFQNPLDVWRTRLQTVVKSHSPHEGPPAEGTLATLLKQRRLMMRGMSMTLIRNLPGNGVYFASFEFLRHNCEVNQGFGLSPSLQQLLCGGLTGIAFHLSFYPTEVVRTRMMVSDKGGVFDIGKEIVRTMGFSGFYRGAGIIVLKSFPVTAIGFWSLHAMESVLGLR